MAKDLSYWAYRAAGGGIPGWGGQSKKSNLMSFAQGLFDTVEPIVKHRANVFDNWADQELANVSPMKAREYEDLKNSYQEKRKQFILGGPAEQGMMMNEMYQDLKDVKDLHGLRRKVATQGKNKESGYADNPRFMGGPEIESLVKSMNGAPLRNEQGQLGYMMWDREQGQNTFKTFTEINKWLDDWSRDPATAEAISTYLEETGEQSVGLPFEKKIYDWQGNYKTVADRIVRNGDLKTLNEYQNAPGRIFRDDFIDMCQNIKYEDIGVVTGKPTTNNFLALGDGDRDRLVSMIDKFDPTADGKVSEKDAIEIYNRLVQDEAMNREYLSAYVTNLGEDQWLYARRFRADAPDQDVTSPAVFAGEGEYDDKGAPGKFKYRVNSESKNWETWSTEKEQWIDLSKNEEAINKLNEWYPKSGANGFANYKEEMESVLDGLSDENKSVMTDWWNTRSADEQKKLHSNKNWQNEFNAWLEENGFDPSQFTVQSPGEDNNKKGDDKQVVNEAHFLADKESNLFKAFAGKFDGQRIAMDNPKIVAFLNNNPDIKRMLEDKTLTNKEKFNKLYKEYNFNSRPIYGSSINKKYA